MPVTTDILTQQLAIGGCSVGGEGSHARASRSARTIRPRRASAGPSAKRLRLRIGRRRRLGGLAARICRTRDSRRRHRIACRSHRRISASRFCGRIRHPCSARRPLAEALAIARQESRSTFCRKAAVRGRPSRPAPTTIPHPKAMGAVRGTLKYMSLPALVELKLAAGRLRDEADVLELATRESRPAGRSARPLGDRPSAVRDTVRRTCRAD